MRDMSVARVRIYVKRPMNIPSRYSVMFHGRTDIAVGTYQYSFPLCNVHKEKLVSDFTKRYSHQIKFDFKLNGYRNM